MIELTPRTVLTYGLAFITAWTLVVYLTPLTIRVAQTFKITDTPDGRLKKHTTPTPYLGGLAVAASFVVTFSVFSTEETAGIRAMGILAGGFMMVMLGLYDDLLNLRPSVKFVGQLLAAIVLFKAGIRTDIPLVGTEWAEWDTVFNFGLTILWVTAIANAFNIIDVMDGLATGTALIASLFLFAISVTIGDDPVVPFMAIVLAGALFGFLKFNFAPARIFLGDTGSLFIGFMVGGLAMLVSYTSPPGNGNALAVATPVVLLAIPIFDTAFVAWHRARKGIPFFRGSPDHFALRLRHSGRGVRQIAFAAYRVAVALGLVSLGLVFAPDAYVVPLLGVFALGLVIAFVRLSRFAPPER